MQYANVRAWESEIILGKNAIRLWWMCRLCIFLIFSLSLPSLYVHLSRHDKCNLTLSLAHTRGYNNGDGVLKLFNGDGWTHSSYRFVNVYEKVIHLNKTRKRLTWLCITDWVSLLPFSLSLSLTLTQWERKQGIANKARTKASSSEWREEKWKTLRGAKSEPHKLTKTYIQKWAKEISSLAPSFYCSLIEWHYYVPLSQQQQRATYSFTATS